MLLLLHIISKKWLILLLESSKWLLLEWFILEWLLLILHVKCVLIILIILSKCKTCLLGLKWFVLLLLLIAKIELHNLKI